MKKQPKVLKATDNWLRMQIQTLLGNILDVPNRFYDQGGAMLTPEQLPDDMPFERRVYETIFLDPPRADRQTVMLKVLAATAEKDHEAVRQQFETLQSTPDGEVSHLAAALNFALNRQRMSAAVKSIEERLESGEMDLGDIYRQGLEDIMAARPDDADSARRMTQVERFEDYLAKRKRRREERAKGIVRELAWPFPSLNYLVPVVRYSDLVVLTAQTKAGKSTLQSIMSEYWAWQQGFDVLVLQWETDHESFQERQVARHLNIPIRYQRGDLVNEEDERLLAYRPDGVRVSFKSLFDWFGNKLKKKALEDGECIYFHCPKWSVQQARVAIAIQRRLSAKRGRTLVVVMDHLTAIPKPKGYREDRTALEDLFNDIKTIPEEFAETDNPIYCFLLDQEKNAEDETVPDDPAKIMEKLKNIRSRGTAMGAIRAQIQLSLQRPIAQFEAPVIYEYIDKETGEKKQYQALDALGNKRFYHLPGQQSGFSWIFVTRANDGTPGWVDVRIENELFRVTEAGEQTCPVIRQRIEEEKELKERFGVA
jgi:hypothetical protein